MKYSSQTCASRWRLPSREAVEHRFQAHISSGDIRACIHWKPFELAVYRSVAGSIVHLLICLEHDEAAQVIPVSSSVVVLYCSDQTFNPRDQHNFLDFFCQSGLLLRLRCTVSVPQQVDRLRFELRFILNVSGQCIPSIWASMRSEFGRWSWM